MNHCYRLSHHFRLSHRYCLRLSPQLQAAGAAAADMNDDDCYDCDVDDDADDADVQAVAANVQPADQLAFDRCCLLQSQQLQLQRLQHWCSLHAAAAVGAADAAAAEQQQQAVMQQPFQAWLRLLDLSLLRLRQQRLQPHSAVTLDADDGCARGC